MLLDRFLDSSFVSDLAAVLVGTADSSDDRVQHSKYTLHSSEADASQRCCKCASTIWNLLDINVDFSIDASPAVSCFCERR